MREIKFRAWDTVNEIWLKITGFETHISDDDKTASINTGLAGMFHDGDYIGTFQKHGEEQNNVILVEYTGLKDVNGVEIFEGDILRVWVTKTINFVAMVDCLNGAFGIGSIPSGYGYHHKFSPFHNNSWTRYEVIGNIYENSELLSE